MRSETEVLAQVVRHLETLDIPYMVTGPFASSVHGAGELGVLDLWHRIAST